MRPGGRRAAQCPAVRIRRLRPGCRRPAYSQSASQPITLPLADSIVCVTYWLLRRWASNATRKPPTSRSARRWKAARTLDRKGRPMLIKLKGKVEAFYK